MHLESTQSLHKVFHDTLLSGSKDAAIAALLYTTATILQSLGARNLDRLTYLVLSQLKIVVTPLFARFILNQRYPLKSWLYISMMAVGIILVQLGSSSGKMDTNGFNSHTTAHGVLAMLLAGVCVALGSIYIEKTLKRSGHLLGCNAQLAAYSFSFGLLYYTWFTKLNFMNFFQGFCLTVWVYLALQVSGGFLVAWCVQISSTVTKNHAQGLAFVLATVLSLSLTHWRINNQV